MNEVPKVTPIKTIRMGSVSASIWKRSNERGTFYSVSFQRSYADGLDADGKQVFKYTDSFGYADLASLKLCALMAETAIAGFIVSEQG